MAEIEEVKTYVLKGVEVFSIGEWNGDKYELNDLHAMVDCFNSTKGGWRPYLKLGHDNKQIVAKSTGLPSLGWVDKLYVLGTKLLADFSYVPEKIYRAIQARAYRKVSCEIYWNIEFNGVKYPRLLSAIALLGAEQPGVMNLDDILGSYGYPIPALRTVFAFGEKEDNVKEYSHTFELETQEDLSMADDSKIQELEAQLEAQKKEFAAAKEAKIAADNEIVELKKFKEEADAARIKAELAAKEADLSKYVTEMDSEKLLTPATKKIVEQLLSDKKEYTLNDKPASQREMIKDLIKLSREAGKVNLEEGSVSEYAKNKGGSDEMDKEVSKYAADNKCSYAEALKKVNAMKKNSKKNMDADE